MLQQTLIYHNKSDDITQPLLYPTNESVNVTHSVNEDLLIDEFELKSVNKCVQNGARMRPPSGTPQKTTPFPKIRFLFIHPWKTMFDA